MGLSDLLDLTPYHYKIYVSGFFQAGKTAFIHKLDPYAISTEKDYPELNGSENTTTTIGYDLGRLVWLRNPKKTYGFTLPQRDFKEEEHIYEEWDVKHIELRGASGLPHFKVVRDAVIDGSHGSLFLVDSTDTAVLTYVKSLLYETRIFLPHAPIMYVANKQDLMNSVAPEVVASWINVPEASGLSCKSTRQDCEEVLINLLRRIEMNQFPLSKERP